MLCRSRLGVLLLAVSVPRDTEATRHLTSTRSLDSHNVRSSAQLTGRDLTVVSLRVFQFPCCRSPLSSSSRIQLHLPQRALFSVLLRIQFVMSCRGGEKNVQCLCTLTQEELMPSDSPEGTRCSAPACRHLRSDHVQQGVGSIGQ